VIAKIAKLIKEENTKNLNNLWHRMNLKRAILNYSDWNRIVESNLNFDQNSFLKFSILEQDEQRSLIPNWLEWTRDVLWSGTDQSANVIFINSQPELKISGDQSGTEGVNLIQISFKGAKCTKNGQTKFIGSTGPFLLYARSDEPWFLYESLEGAQTKSTSQGRFSAKWGGFIFNEIKKTSGQTLATVNQQGLPAQITNDVVNWAKGNFLQLLWNSKARISWTYISLYNLGIIDLAKEDINKAIKFPKNITIKDPGIKSSFYDIQKNIESSMKTNESMYYIKPFAIFEQDEYYKQTVDSEGNEVSLVKYNVIDEIVIRESASEEEKKAAWDRCEKYNEEGHRVVPKSLFTNNPDDLGIRLVLEREFDEVVIKLDKKTGKISTWINKLKAKTKAAGRTILMPKSDKTYKAWEAIALAESDLLRTLKKKLPKKFYNKKDAMSKEGLDAVIKLWKENKISESDYKRFRAVLYEWDEETKNKEKEASKSLLDKLWDDAKWFGEEAKKGFDDAYNTGKKIVTNVKDGVISAGEATAKAISDGWNVLQLDPNNTFHQKEIQAAFDKIGEIKDDVVEWGKEEGINFIENTLTPYGIYISLDNLNVEVVEINNPALSKIKDAAPTIKADVNGTISIITQIKGGKTSGVDIEVNGDLQLEGDVDLDKKALTIKFKSLSLETIGESDLSGLFSDNSLSNFLPYFKIYNKENGKSTAKIWWENTFTGNEIYNWEFNLQTPLEKSIVAELNKYKGYSLDKYLQGVPEFTNK